MLTLGLVASLFAGTGAIEHTIGVMTPVIPYWVPKREISFQQMATAIILAIHHVNQRNGSLVGDAINLLPAGFTLKYKLADTRYKSDYAVQALLEWRGQEGYKAFQSCATTQTTGNLTSNATIMYESLPATKIEAIVGNSSLTP